MIEYTNETNSSRVLGGKNERKGKSVLTMVAKDFVNSHGFTQSLGWNEKEWRWTDYRIGAGEVVPNCPLSVPTYLKESGYATQVQRRLPLPTVCREIELQEQARHGSLPVATLLSWAKKYLSQIPLMMVQVGSSKGYIRPIDKRGLQTYQERTSRRISSALVNLQKQYKYCYFYTSTYDVKTHGVDLLHSFKTVKEQSRIIQRNVRRVLKGDYVNVFEFTKKGYAHAHTVLGTNCEIANPDRNTFIKKRLRGGNLYKILTKGILSPVLEIRGLEKRGFSSYLQKYLSKGLSLPDVSSFWKVPDNKGNVIKQIYGILIPYLTGLRQFSVSQGLRAGGGEALYLDSDKIKKQLDRMRWLLNTGCATDMFWVDEYKGLASNLINTMYKLTNHCRNHVYLLANKIPVTDGLNKSTVVDFKEDHNLLAILDGAKHLNCTGCPIVRILDEIQGKTDIFRPIIRAFHRQGEKGIFDTALIHSRFFQS